MSSVWWITLLEVQVYTPHDTALPRQDLNLCAAPVTERLLEGEETAQNEMRLRPFQFLGRFLCLQGRAVTGCTPGRHQRFRKLTFGPATR
jgi:hypothetical protein